MLARNHAKVLYHSDGPKPTLQMIKHMKHITLLHCIFADGAETPPILLLPRKTLPVFSLAQQRLFYIGGSAKGWMTRRAFLECLKMIAKEFQRVGFSFLFRICSHFRALSRQRRKEHGWREEEPALLILDRAPSHCPPLTADEIMYLTTKDPPAAAAHAPGAPQIIDDDDDEDPAYEEKGDYDGNPYRDDGAPNPDAVSDGDEETPEDAAFLLEEMRKLLRANHIDILWLPRRSTSVLPQLRPS
jgi:hypothetical protein